MFCWRVDTVLEELAQHAPDVLTAVDEALTYDSDGFADAYDKPPAISIDHALVERTDRALVIDSGIRRVDLGSWATIGTLWPKDDAGNATIGDFALFDTCDSIIHSEGVLTAAVGVENLVVVATEHAVLVCDRKRANEVGELVKTIQCAGKTEATLRMCGIWGIYRRDRAQPIDEADIARMGDVMPYRGPDDRGSYVAAGIGFGHLRLSIIDLSAAARQPMATPDGRYQIILNGEIFNYLELRAELEAKGIRFHSNSDTEVALALYREIGPSCVHRFNGMFALQSTIPSKHNSSWSATRLGIKPVVLPDPVH